MYYTDFKRSIYMLLGLAEDALASFAVFTDKGVKARSRHVTELLGDWNDLPEDLPDFYQRLLETNERGWKVSLTPNPVRVGMENEHPTESDISQFTCVFVDADAPHITLADFEAFEFEPTIVVESSPGKFHVYWAIQGIVPNTPDNLAFVRSLQRGLAQAFGLKVWLTPRQPMAVPGTRNTKYPDAWVKPVHVGFAEYSMEVLKKFPRAEDFQQAIPDSIPRGWQVEANASAYDSILKFLDAHAVEGNRDRVAFRAAAWMRDEGFSFADAEAILLAHGCGGLPPRDIIEKIKSAYRRKAG